LKLKILVFALILVLLVSFYMTVIPSLELVSEKMLMKSLVLHGREGSSSFVTLRMSDALRVVAEVDDASNAYFLTVQGDAGMVFQKQGGIDGSSIEVEVPLYPPSFEAGKNYVLLFYVYAFNYPLLGATISDMGVVGFAVADSPTNLNLEASYDGVFRCLSLYANLTNADGCPVADENVDFYSRPDNGRRRLTYGWMAIGSAKTNDSGVASLGLVFSVPDGNYSLKAHHKGDENFGESEKVMGINVLSDASMEGLNLDFGSKFGFTSAVLSEGVGDLTIEVSSSAPYAVLPMSVTPTYVVNDDLGVLVALFFLDSVNGTWLGGYGQEPQGEDPPYTYEYALIWEPNVTGFHKIVVVIADWPDFTNIASGEVDLDIQYCPSNMVLHFPEACVGDVLPVTVAFSKPRLYEEGDNGFFVGSTLAPQLLYDNENYVIDESVESVPVKLFVNDTLTAINSTDVDGLAFIPLQLSSSNIHFVLSLRGVFDDPSLPYEEATVERVVNFTRVDVHEVAAGGSDLFELNCTIAEPSQGDEIYVGTENLIIVKTRLFDLPVWNASASVLIGKPLKRDCTNSSGCASIPDGSELLRVSCLYDIQSTSACAACDVICDGQVDMVDISAVIDAFMTEPGDASWNWRADVDFDLIADMADLSRCIYAFGGSINYTSVVGYGAVKIVFFKDGQQEEAWLDGGGCVSVPNGTTGFELSVGGEPVGAVVEFFKSDFHQECHTDNLGVTRVVWTPTETALEVPSYFLLVSLLASFQVSVTRRSEVTFVDAYLCLVDFLNVEKRPLDLSVDYVPDEPTLDDEITMIANVFDLGLGEPAEDLLVGFGISGLTFPDGEEVWIEIGYELTNSSGVATISFVPRYYKDEYNLFPYFYVVVGCLETWCTLYSEAYVLLDTRYPTRLEFRGEEVIHADVSETFYLDFRLVRVDNSEPVVGRPVNLYVNDTYQNCTGTDDNGTCTFEVTIFEEGLYFFRAWFHWSEECVDDEYVDGLYQDSNNATFVIVAEAEPVFILFTVQPEELTPDTSVTLSATVLNATSNDPLPDFWVWFYWCAENGTCGTVGHDFTNTEGVASVPWIYPDDGSVYVFWASVNDAQQIVSSPVTLTVGEATRLSMNVEPGDGFNHVISGRLLCDGVGVADEQVVIKVNGTIVDVVTTAGDGGYSTTLNLQPVDNEPTSYQVEAVYYGDDALNLTGLATLPDDTEYAVCTTLQYFGYKPSSNTAMLTVEPQSTQVMTSTKTPEELQQEAEDSGWLSTWHEFTWWYPWYRLHIKININPVIDVGFNPLLPGGETWFWDGLEIFAEVIAEFVEELAIDIGILFLEYIVAKGLSMVPITWVPAVIALTAKGLTQGWLLWTDWNNQAKMLAVSLVNFAMGLIALRASIGVAFINALFNIVYAPTMSALYLLQNKLITAAEPIQHIRTWIDGFEMGMDFSFGLTALARFLGWI
jgi:hypothetical protein